MFSVCSTNSDNFRSPPGGRPWPVDILKLRFGQFNVCLSVVNSDNFRSPPGGSARPVWKAKFEKWSDPGSPGVRIPLFG